MNRFSKMTAAIALWSRLALSAAVLCIGAFAAAETNTAAAFKVEERNFQRKGMKISGELFIPDRCFSQRIEC